MQNSAAPVAILACLAIEIGCRVSPAGEKQTFASEELARLQKDFAVPQLAANEDKLGAEGTPIDGQLGKEVNVLRKDEDAVIRGQEGYAEWPSREGEVWSYDEQGSWSSWEEY